MVLEAHWANHSTAGTASFQDALAMVRGGARRPQFAAACRTGPAGGTGGKNLRRALQAKDRSRRIKARRRSVFCDRASRRCTIIGSRRVRISGAWRVRSPRVRSTCAVARSHRRIARGTLAEKISHDIAGLRGRSRRWPATGRARVPRAGERDTRTTSTTASSTFETRSCGDTAHRRRKSSRGAWLPRERCALDRRTGARGFGSSAAAAWLQPR